jgi:UDP-N-acetylglucosamine--N-acetylmuramyl-(pentapeptide) pyrophosphoryl-undecaprenol N-acetylglucosamine transferase
MEANAVGWAKAWRAVRRASRAHAGQCDAWARLAQSARLCPPYETAPNTGTSHSDFAHPTEQEPGATSPVILLAAGGTGGHLFPAEALAAALARRGIAVELATDERGGRYGKKFPARAAHAVASETVRARNPLALARTLAMLGIGMMQSLRLIGQIKPAAVVGFGGYPTLPPLIAARLQKIPTVIHEQNAVMGRANRLLAGRATAIATGFAGVVANDASLAAKATRTGNPVRPAVIAAAASPYEAPQPDGLLRIVVSGGSQGARIMSDIVPAAVERLDLALRARLLIAQQAREEDLARVRETYARLNIAAEVAAFFPDLPERIASAHLVVTRAGASTVAELAAIGRPAILVPLPHALDQDQFANAGTLEAAGGAIRLRQEAFTPERVAAEITSLAGAPGRLLAMASAARAEGALDAAERLADLVMKVAQS